MGANSTVCNEEQDLPHGRIIPFAHGVQSLGVRLEDVVTQPYDKITPAMQQAYYSAARITWCASFSACRSSLTPSAARAFIRGGARLPRLARARRPGAGEDPCIFAYSQRFKVPGTEILKERRGFIALGKLHDYAESGLSP